MSEFFIKDGVLFEKDFLGDREVGPIEHSVTGDYVIDGLHMYYIDQDLGGNIELIMERDYINNEVTGVEITKNPFRSHGQESHEFSRQIWKNDDQQDDEEEEHETMDQDDKETGNNIINNPSSLDDTDDDDNDDKPTYTYYGSDNGKEIATGSTRIWSITSSVQPKKSHAKRTKTVDKEGNKVLISIAGFLVIIAIPFIAVMYFSDFNMINTKPVTKGMMLSSYEGSYLVPADEAFDESEIIFKVINSKLIGLCEQRVNPMGGLAKRKYEVTSLNSDGEGEYIYTYAIYSRWEELLQENTEAEKGQIHFMGNKVKIGKQVYVKTK